MVELLVEVRQFSLELIMIGFGSSLERGVLALLGFCIAGNGLFDFLEISCNWREICLYQLSDLLVQGSQ